MSRLLTALTVSSLSFGILSQAATITVPGTANPWLAGVTDPNVVDPGGDKIPDEAPVPFTAFTPGARLQFSVPDTDTAGFAPGSEFQAEGVPDYFVSHNAEFGVGAIQNPLADSLLGVFTGGPAPDDAHVPDPLDFGTDAARNYVELSPELWQPFYIGSGHTTAGQPRIVIAPAGATTLYLGICDGTSWYNNTGAFHVDINVTGGSGATSYPLTLAVNPPDAPSITATPAPGADGKYPAGTSVHLTVTENRYVLDNWTGVDSVDSTGATVLMNVPRSVTAEFHKLSALDALIEGQCDCVANCLIELLGDAVGNASPTSKRTAIVTALSAGKLTFDPNLLRKFRDQVLAHGVEGQKLITQYSTLSAELFNLGYQNPDILALMNNAVVALQPILTDMINGTGEQLITSDQMTAVNALLTKLTQAGGLKLRTTIQDQLARIGPLQNLVGKSTAAVRSAVAGVQMEIVNPHFATDGFLQFTVTGILPSGAVHAESSDDLQTWTPLTTGALSTLPATITDPQPPSARERFYRISVIPGAP